VTDYEYELRQDEAVVATGRILLERAPKPGETLRLGSRTVRVLDVLQLLGARRLILAA
jgi:hypothetical protein